MNKKRGRRERDARKLERCYREGEDRCHHARSTHERNQGHMQLISEILTNYRNNPANEDLRRAYEILLQAGIITE